MSRLLPNPAADRGWDAPAANRRALAFHRGFPEYEPTPLVALPAIAGQLGLDELLAKDESTRLGLPSFKILGASWAAAHAVAEARGLPIDARTSLEQLRAGVAGSGLELVAATDGNHGRAVAHVARLLGIESRIFVPAGTAAARVEAIESEGAAVTVVDGSYDEAVEIAAAQASPATLVVADISWPGYEELPLRIVNGYSTILWELEDQSAPEPDLVLVQMGCGSLASAVLRHYRQPGRAHRPILVGVEPEGAACVFAALEAGEIVHLPGRQDSIMAGLNCGTASTATFDELRRGLDYSLTIPDELAAYAMRMLAREGHTCGETGGAGLAGLIQLRQRSHGLPDDLLAARSALVFLTEGNTDPAAHRDIVGAGREV